MWNWWISVEYLIADICICLPWNCLTSGVHLPGQKLYICIFSRCWTFAEHTRVKTCKHSFSKIVRSATCMPLALATATRDTRFLGFSRSPLTKHFHIDLEHPPSPGCFIPRNERGSSENRLQCYAALHTWQSTWKMQKKLLAVLSFAVIVRSKNHFGILQQTLLQSCEHLSLKQLHWPPNWPSLLF